MSSVFGSTYRCEQIFSLINLLKPNGNYTYHLLSKLVKMYFACMNSM
jgi:hypothetical protein